MTIVPVEGVLISLALAATLLTCVAFVFLFSFSICRGLLQKKKRLVAASRVGQAIRMGLSSRSFAPSPKRTAVNERRQDQVRSFPG